MSKRKIILQEGEETFGKRLARLRKAAGYSQRELAAELGISYRMVAYYEGETQYPPAHLLPVLTKALGAPADQLMGMEKIKGNGRGKDTRLWRRFKQVEKLPPLNNATGYQSQRRPGLLDRSGCSSLGAK
jgi:transcriptional regulator with XRE-family HTH domain